MAVHEVFLKAAPQHPGLGNEVGGAALLGTAGATAPVLRTGSKDPHQPVSASPKKEPRNYQGELTRAMREGKVEGNSTLRVLKTPSGRYLNAGGTHRHLARQAMGQPTTKTEVKNLGFEPRQSLLDRSKHRSHLKSLRQGAQDAVVGNAGKVSDHAREANHHLARAADIADDAFWHSIGPKGAGSAVVRGQKLMHRTALGQAAVVGGMGAALIHSGIKEHRDSKVGKSMDGHDAFLGEPEVISKIRAEGANGYRPATSDRVKWAGGVGTAVGGSAVLGHGLGKIATKRGGGKAALAGAALTGAGLATAARAGQRNQNRYDNYMSKSAFLDEDVEKRFFSAKSRKKAAKDGDALPDGSFPIKNKKDLKNAERLEGHSKHPAEVEAFINEKKKELSKGLSGHDAFCAGVISKGILGDLTGAVKGAGMGGMKAAGSLVRKNPMGAAMGAGAGLGGALGGQHKALGAGIGAGAGLGGLKAAQAFKGVRALG